MSADLPRLIVVTDRMQAAGPLTEVLAAAVDAGARAVLLRDKDLPLAERAVLAHAIAAVLAPVGGLLLWGGAAASTGRAAVHLSAADAVPVPRPGLLGRSCHSTAEVAAAGAEGCDYVFVSPVNRTPSKPGYGPALGPAGLARLTAGVPPVFALGGVLPADVGACLAAGAHGVAVMGPVMRQPSVVATYLEAVAPPSGVKTVTGGLGAGVAAHSALPVEVCSPSSDC